MYVGEPFSVSVPQRQEKGRSKRRNEDEMKRAIVFLKALLLFALSYGIAPAAPPLTSAPVTVTNTSNNPVPATGNVGISGTPTVSVANSKNPVLLHTCGLSGEGGAQAVLSAGECPYPVTPYRAPATKYYPCANHPSLPMTSTPASSRAGIVATVSKLVKLYVTEGNDVWIAIGSWNYGGRVRRLTETVY